MVTETQNSKYLLSNKFRIASLGFAFLGIILYSLRFFFGKKFDFFNWTVFAFASDFLEKKYLTFIKNNVLEELILGSFLFAVYLAALSKEKNELPEFNQFRLESILLAFWTNLFFNLIGICFFFGFSYLWIIIINLYSIPFIYFCILKYKIFRK